MADERTLAAYGLTEDLQVAGSSWQILMQLHSMNGEASSFTRLADDFMWFCMRSMRDNAVVHLWKAYDTEPKAHSLAWFVRTQSTLEDHIKDTDLALLNVKNDALRRLAILRHQVIAHRGKSSNAKGSNNVISQNDISADFPALVQTGLKVLSRHFGGHLPNRVPYDSSAAVKQLRELDTYLRDASRGRWGIEGRHEVIDGDVQGSAKRR